MLVYIIISIILLLIIALFLYALCTWTSVTTAKNRLQPTLDNRTNKNPLTIFLVTNNYTPFSGGVVSAIDAHAQELRALGHRAIIITLDFTAIQAPENDVIRLWCPIRFLYHRNHMAIPWRPTHTIYDLAQQYKPDIIHVYHPFLLGASGLKVGKKLKIPVIFSYLTLYDQYTHYVPLPEIITKPITRYLVNNFCAKADTLIVPGKSIAQYIQAQGIKRPMEIMPLSIMPIFIHPLCTPKRVTPYSRNILLCVSRFTPEKNLFFLLDMFKKLEPNSYTLVFIGYGSLEEELKKYAYETLNLSHNDIMFIIKPSKKELCDWYAKAHLFIFASYSETQGLVLAEAMASCTPVVALQAPGIEDIIVHDTNGYMVHTQQEMASTIDSILAAPELYAKLQHQAWLTARNYSPRARALKLIDLYATFTSGTKTT